MSSCAAQPPIATDPSTHPAVAAWSQVRQGGLAPVAAVTPLKAQQKPSHKSGVYRLHAAGAGGANVVAKRCRHATLARERLIYEQVLPHLPLPSPRFYGSLGDADGICGWLFIEDLGDRSYDDAELGPLVQWLARFHASAATVPVSATLPDCGPAAYRAHVAAGHRRLIANIDAPHFTAAERDLLGRVVGLCETLQRRWDELEAFCRHVPKTLVHGDRSRKNVRVRRIGTRLEFFAIDWETAGWGVPAADLGVLSARGSDAEALIGAYCDAIEPHWRCTAADIATLAHVGLVFRLAAGIDWASHSLPYPPGRKSTRYMRDYETQLLAAIDRLGWTG